jgi:hypothetical protein
MYPHITQFETRQLVLERDLRLHAEPAVGGARKRPASSGRSRLVGTSRRLLARMAVTVGR